MSTFPVVPLAALLRAELAGYGGLLALFERQQEQIWRREIQTVTDTSAAIEALAAETAVHRRAREEWVSRFATEHDHPADTTLRQLLPFFPADQQPMLAAFIDEINQLIQRVRRRAHQNQGVLARAVDVHREALSFFNPGGRPRTYAPNGHVSALADSVLSFHIAG